MFINIKAYLEKHCSATIYNIKQLEKSDFPLRTTYVYGLKGNVEIEKKQLSLIVVFRKDFPLTKPDIFLVNKDELYFIPHVEPDGYICFVHDEGLLLDQDNPSGIVEESLIRAIKTIVDGMNGINRIDFLEEFEIYWSRRDNNKEVPCLIHIEEQIKPVYFFYDEKLQTPIFASDVYDYKNKNYVHQLLGYDAFKNTKVHKGIFIPLRKGTKIYPPSYEESWNIKDLRRIIYQNITGSNKRILDKFLKNKKITQDSFEYLVLAIPQLQENTVLIGIEMSNFRPKKGERKRKGFQHPLLNNKCEFKFTSLSFKRHNPSFLLQRTNGYENIQDKNVCVIGLGAIGSRVTMELIRAGVSKLTLIDKDLIDIENVHRHELGVDQLNLYDKEKHNIIPLPKVFGMANEIKRKFPLVEVDAKPEDIQEILREHSSFFEYFDIVIVAIGNPTVEMYINRIIRELRNPPPTIFTWLEPLGIGGHALLSFNGGKPGCYECLYTNQYNPNAELKNKASFAAPNQFFGKMLSGCQSVFTPYGSLDALQTTIITTRLAISVLTGKENDNPLISYKGDCTDFLEQGFKLSRRYELTFEQLFLSRYQYKTSKCPICGQDDENGLLVK